MTKVSRMLHTKLVMVRFSLLEISQGPLLIYSAMGWPQRPTTQLHHPRNSCTRNLPMVKACQWRTAKDQPNSNMDTTRSQGCDHASSRLT